MLAGKGEMFRLSGILFLVIKVVKILSSELIVFVTKYSLLSGYMLPNFKMGLLILINLNLSIFYLLLVEDGI